jgi:hypothetical protein
MNEPKLCPMLFAAAGLPYLHDGAKCFQEKCAWWVHFCQDESGRDLSHCAIVDLAWLANTGRRE